MPKVYKAWTQFLWAGQALAWWMQAYQALVCWKKGGCHNGSNIIGTALCRGIPNPRQLLIEHMEEGGVHAKVQKRALRDTSSAHRKAHLREYFWKWVREAPLHPTLAFTATAHSEKIFSFLSRKITLISKTGVPPEHRSYRLSVMLENIAHLALVNKLCTIRLI